MMALARMAFALAPLMAVWTVVAAIASFETARANLAKSARRGLIASTTCSVIAIALLMAALLRHDFTVQYVVANNSWHMPARFAAAAALHDAGGALLAWAACSGIATLVALRFCASGRMRTWVTAIAAGAQGVAVVAVAASGSPFAPATGAVPDGAGIPPELQGGAAVAHGILLLVGASAALPAFALTVAAMATGKLNTGWDRTVRIWNAVAWSALLAGAVAGVRWFALDPMRGSWLGDRATLFWLFPVAIGAWLLHLDAGRTSADRVAMRTLLVAAMFVGVTAAMAALSGAFITGGATVDPIAATIAHASGAGAPAGIWFALVPVGAIALTLARLRSGRGALAASRAIERPPPHAVGGWLAHAGFILLIGAAIGASSSRHYDVALADAEIFRASDQFGHQWSFASQGVSTLQRENYGSLTVSLLASRDDVRLPMLSAEARSYFSDDPAAIPAAAFVGQSVSNAFVETRLTMIDPDAAPERLRISFVPLAGWLVPGAALMVLGTLLPLVGRSEGTK